MLPFGSITPGNMTFILLDVLHKVHFFAAPGEIKQTQIL